MRRYRGALSGSSAPVSEDGRPWPATAMARATYRYFAEPVPEPVASRSGDGLYAPLAADSQPLGPSGCARTARFPEDTLDGVSPASAQRAGQTAPYAVDTRLSRAGGYNCLHQDVYGELAFPLQVGRDAEPSRRSDFEGGEFLLVEQRPRMQSRGEADRAGARVEFVDLSRTSCVPSRARGATIV